MKKLLLTFLIFTIWVMAPGQNFQRVKDFEDQSGLVNSTGVAVSDYDLDGDLDLFVVASQVFDLSDSMTWSRLLLNENGQYKDVTMQANLINWEAETRDGTMGSKMGASWGDYDNDGYPDLFIANYGLDELWHNEGDGTFRNMTLEAGVAGCFYCYSTGGVWWDYDQDGDLDLYVHDWIKRNRLFRNDGNDKFVDVSVASNLDDRGHTFSSLPFDWNYDGFTDLYVINDIGANHFYSNLGDGTFIDLTEQLGLSNRGNGMGIDICDYNNDGHFDIYLTNIYKYVPNPFFVNNGDGTFSDLSADLGIENTGWGWAARFFDFDNDRDEDLYVVNGFEASIAAGDRNMFFKNNEGVFVDLSSELAVNSPNWAMCLEVFDYDLDGDLDMLVANRDAPLDLYENNLQDSDLHQNWIQFTLVGDQSNRNGFGARIKITCGEDSYYRYHTGVNVFGQSIQPLHFGLADLKVVDQVHVDWPSGLSEHFDGLSINQVNFLLEGEGEAVNELTAIDEQSLEIFDVFPNPFDQQLFLAGEVEHAFERISFSLYNIHGRQLLNEWVDLRNQEAQDIIQGSNLQSGIYIYVISSGQEQRRGKVIKI